MYKTNSFKRIKTHKNIILPAFTCQITIIYSHIHIYVFLSNLSLPQNKVLNKYIKLSIFFIQNYFWHLRFCHVNFGGTAWSFAVFLISRYFANFTIFIIMPPRIYIVMHCWSYANRVLTLFSTRVIRIIMGG